MPALKNYYQVLQVDPSADPEVIAAAYKRLSIKYHPDTNPSSDANLRMQELNDAYQVLKDPVKRSHYDQTLRRSHYSEYADYRDGSGPSHETYSQEKPIKRQPVHPLQALASLIISLTFPVTFSLTVFVLFRFFRPYNIVVIIAVLIVAGLIAYYASMRVEKEFRKKE